MLNIECPRALFYNTPCTVYLACDLILKQDGGVCQLAFKILETKHVANNLTADIQLLLRFLSINRRKKILLYKNERKEVLENINESLTRLTASRFPSCKLKLKKYSYILAGNL